MTCLQGKDIQSGELLAVKVYNLNGLGELNKVQLIREIRLHGSFVHRNIIELYTAFQVSLILQEAACMLTYLAAGVKRNS
jgi:serine/threonine protein kinase